ncbi:MAG: type VI secretion system ImpA family N-terminal domain-containing protein [Pseudomonadota bacterium]
MSLDWIRDPISDDAPAGADLWEDGDAEFDEYYFDALGRLPETDDYVKLGRAMSGSNKLPDEIFDPKSVDLKAELSAIDGLLKRTRDTRLITLRALWSALAGNVEELANSLEAMADVIEEMPNDVHPGFADGPRDRLESINDLTQMGAMILPLRYYNIAGSGASRRRIMVCNGDVTPHDGEDDLSIDSMLADLAHNSEEAEAAHGFLTRARDALARIETGCLTCSTPHTPQLNTLKSELGAVIDVINSANPELASDDSDDADAEDGTAAAATPGSPGMVPAPVVTEVKDHEEARKRLIAVETYFGLKEPSSAAVLLVTQARLLIGKSLIDAFDTLAPMTSDRSKVEFIADNGFQLAHQQLRNLADQVLIEEVEEPEPEPEPYVPPAPEPEPEPEPVPEPEPELDAAAEGDGEAPIAEEVADTDATVTDEGEVAETEELQSEAEPEPEPEPEPAPPPAPVEPPKPEVFIVRDQAAATAQIQAVESYFRAVERSSPVPMLLQRARTYIGKDFESLLREFVPEMN